MLVAVADVVVLAVKATLVVTVAVVREGMTVVGSKVLKTSGEWKKQNKTKQNHIMQTKENHNSGLICKYKHVENG